VAEGIDFTSTEEITRHPKVVEAFAGVVETANAGLASYEQIKKHAVLPLMLSIDDSTLTPTLKITRRVVQKQCTDLIEDLYEDDR
jgi:long-chain acyl-CoA synthetase